MLNLLLWRGTWKIFSPVRGPWSQKVWACFSSWMSVSWVSHLINVILISAFACQPNYKSNNKWSVRNVMAKLITAILIWCLFFFICLSLFQRQGFWHSYQYILALRKSSQYMPLLLEESLSCNKNWLCCLAIGTEMSAVGRWWRGL